MPDENRTTALSPIPSERSDAAPVAQGGTDQARQTEEADAAKRLAKKRAGKPAVRPDDGEGREEIARLERRIEELDEQQQRERVVNRLCETNVDWGVTLDHLNLLVQKMKTEVDLMELKRQLAEDKLR